MLLYEYSFADEDDKIESDLASGGLTGLIAILQEITKDEEKLRSIDHGGKRIIFIFSGNLILALITTEELLILRNKLEHFLADVEEKFGIGDYDFTGVDVGLWRNRIDPILEKHFKRKYFDFFTDMILFENDRKKKN
jgi:hypothetical protein